MKTNRPSQIVRLGLELDAIYSEWLALDDRAGEAASWPDDKQRARERMMTRLWNAYTDIVSAVTSLPAVRADEALIQLAVMGSRIESAVEDLPDEARASRERTENAVPVLEGAIRALARYTSSEVKNMRVVQDWLSAAGGAA
jgi:glutathione S-transferase